MNIPAEFNEKKFWSKVDQRSFDECWPWIGKSRSGKNGQYGRYTVRTADGTVALAPHRVVLALLGRPVPRGKVALHSCDNPICCNPAHLRAGTQKENVAESFARGGRTYGPGPGRYEAELTPADCASIRQEVAAGSTQKAVAERRGLSRAVVSLIVNRKRRYADL